MPNYPTSLDSLTNPTSSSALNSPDHTTQHSTLNDIVEALEAKLGIGSSTPSTAGQVLKGTSTGSQYAAPNIYGVGVMSGNYNRAIPGSVSSTVTPTTDVLLLLPFWSSGGSIDRIALNVTVAATGTTWNFGVYGPSSSISTPGSLLLDAGSVSTASTGFKEATVSLTLDVGQYWIGGAPHGTIGSLALSRVRWESWQNSLGLMTGTSLSTTGGMAASQTGVTGSLPSSYSGTTYAQTAPAIWVRWV